VFAKLNTLSSPVPVSPESSFYTEKNTEILMTESQTSKPGAWGEEYKMHIYCTIATTSERIFFIRKTVFLRSRE
jgi:hypothetical protein